MHLEAVRGRRGAAVIADRRRQEVQLQVGVGDAGARADEGAGLEMVGGAEPGAEA